MYEEAGEEDDGEDNDVLADLNWVSGFEPRLQPRTNPRLQPRRLQPRLQPRFMRACVAGPGRCLQRRVRFQQVNHAPQVPPGWRGLLHHGAAGQLHAAQQDAGDIRPGWPEHRGPQGILRRQGLAYQQPRPDQRVRHTPAARAHPPPCTSKRACPPSRASIHASKHACPCVSQVHGLRALQGCGQEQQDPLQARVRRQGAHRILHGPERHPPQE